VVAARRCRRSAEEQRPERQQDYATEEDRRGQQAEACALAEWMTPRPIQLSGLRSIWARKVAQRLGRLWRARQAGAPPSSVETGGGSNSGTSLGGVLKPDPDGIRLKDGVNLDQALTWNGRTCRPDAKVFGQVGDPRETQDADTGHRGRTARRLKTL
jgi:hypothetical protein